MVLTGNSRSSLRKTCPIVTSPTTKFTWTDIGFNPVLGGNRPAAKMDINYILTPSPYRAVNTLRLGYENQSVNAV